MLAASLLGPMAAAVGLISIYNFARFGNPLEIGSSYQLAGFDPRTTPYYQMSYLLPSLYLYVVSPIHFGLNFPFFYIPPPIAPVGAPVSYQPQIVLGVLIAFPIVAMLLAAPFVLRRRLAPLLRGILLTMVALGALVILLIAWSIPGGSERYAVDFSTLLILPACICWLAWSPRRRLGRIAVRAVGAILIVFGVVVGIAVSYTGYYNQILLTQPALATKLSSSTAWVGPLITKILGHPVIESVSSRSGTITRVNWDSYGIGTIIYTNISGQPSNFSVISPSRATWSLTASCGGGPQYTEAGTHPIYLMIRDSAGLHRYRYMLGTNSYPVTVAAGRSTFSISVWVKGHHVPATSSILSCSGMTFHGPSLTGAGG